VNTPLRNYLIVNAYLDLSTTMAFIRLPWAEALGGWQFEKVEL